jgi:hypothetical protein
MFHHDWYVEGLYNILAGDMRCGDKYANIVLDKFSSRFPSNVGEFPSEFSYISVFLENLYIYTQIYRGK